MDTAGSLREVASRLQALGVLTESVPDDLENSIPARAHFAAVLAKQLKRMRCSSASFATLLFPVPETSKKTLEFLDELLAQRAPQRPSMEETHTMSRCKRLHALIRVLTQDNANVKDRLRIEQRARQLAESNDSTNRSRLVELVTDSRMRLLDWVREWELVRGPLVTRILEKSTVDLDVLPLSSLPDSSKELKHDALSSSSLPMEDEDEDDDGLEQRAEVLMRLTDAVQQRFKLESELQRMIREVRDLQLDISSASDKLLAVETQCEQVIDASHYQGPATLEFLSLVRVRFDALVELDHQAHVADAEAKQVSRRVQAVAARVKDLDVDKVRAMMPLLSSPQPTSRPLGSSSSQHAVPTTLPR